MSKIVIVRVRGGVRVKKDIRDTLDMLNLKAQNNCAIVEDTPAVKGMLRKVQGYVTYGVADEETIKLLESKKEEGKKTIRLQPPKKGYGRKGIKVPFVKSGALGDRKEKISDLISRMV